MKIILDTNRYTDFRRGDAGVAQVLETAEAIFMPLPVLAELRVGFTGGRRGIENEQDLQRFLALPLVAILYPDERTTHHYAAVYHHLRRQGTPIPTNDMWIAALALQHGLALYARDKHFDHLPQLQRI
jgi:tRNA(fMet)-specific endonuclease VapC